MIDFLFIPHKKPALLSVLLFTLVLAGCGGGGSSGRQSDTESTVIDDTASTVEGQPVWIDVLANDDPDKELLIASIEPQPSHGTASITTDDSTPFNRGYGINYHPDPGYTGTDTFTYTVVTEGIFVYGSATVTVVIHAADTDVLEAAGDNADTLVNTPVEIDVLANDAGSGLEVQSVADPAGGTTVNQATSILYTPDSGFTGTDIFTYTVMDQDGVTDTASIAVTVWAENTAPVAEDDNASTIDNSNISIDVLDNDSDADGDVLMISEVSQPDNGTATIGYTGMGMGTYIHYEANIGFTGIDTFSYTINDSHWNGTDTATVTVTVEPNTPPDAVDDSVTIVEGQTALIDVLANDTDPEGLALYISEVDTPLHGSAIIEDTHISYTPNDGFTGTDTFDYTVSDSLGAASTATVTVTVEPNAAPVAVSDFVSSMENTTVLIDVLANDTDPEGLALHISDVTTPIHGSAIIEGNNISYTPNEGYTGTDTFNYTVNDHLNASSTASVWVTVMPVVIRVSVDSSGNQAIGSGFFLTGSPAISADGGFVVFRSAASNLVADDSNAEEDVFLYDIDNTTTSLLSTGHDVPQANGGSRDPAISADGRYVVFRSSAYNLVASDGNAAADIFLRDTQDDTTTMITQDTTGSWANDASYYPDISADGRYVVYYSAASDLVSGDSNGVLDIFLHDTQSGDTTRISVASDGTEANGNSLYPAISTDGKYVAFESTATNLVTGDTNGKSDIFLHEIQTGTTTRVSVDSSGQEGNNPSRKPAISADGRYIVFESSASNLVEGDTNSAYDIFRHDTQTGDTFRVSVDSTGAQSDDYANSYSPAISDDGRIVSFYSSAGNLVSGDSTYWEDIFIHDTQTGKTIMVSVDAFGNQANGRSVFAEISADGRYVVYYSEADNLVHEADTNGLDDAFRVDVTALPGTESTSP